jgi:hypothetical protein
LPEFHGNVPEIPGIVAEIAGIVLEASKIIRPGLAHVFFMLLFILRGKT